MYCLRSMSWFTFFVCVCVCDSLLHFSIARQKKKIDDRLFLACMLCFPKSGNLPFDISLIIHTYMHVDARARTTFARNSSLGCHHVLWSTADYEGLDGVNWQLTIGQNFNYWDWGDHVRVKTDVSLPWTFCPFLKICSP